MGAGRGSGVFMSPKYHADCLLVKGATVNRPGHTGPPEKPCGRPPDDRHAPSGVFPQYHEPHDWQDDDLRVYWCYGDTPALDVMPDPGVRTMDLLE